MTPQQTKALVLVDLQNGPLALAQSPRDGEAVRSTALRLAAACHAAGILVIMVHASPIGDGQDRLRTPVDDPIVLPSPAPDDFFGFGKDVAGAADIFVVKRQWGGFYGTDLDLQLRRRGVTTVVVGGVLTNFGVESTARSAWEHGYEVIVVEDATAALTASDQELAITRIFPRLGRVLAADEFVASLQSRSDLAHAADIAVEADGHTIAGR